MDINQTDIDSSQSGPLPFLSISLASVKGRNKNDFVILLELVLQLPQALPINIIDQDQNSRTPVVHGANGKRKPFQPLPVNKRKIDTYTESATINSSGRSLTRVSRM